MLAVLKLRISKPCNICPEDHLPDSQIFYANCSQNPITYPHHMGTRITDFYAICSQNTITYTPITTYIAPKDHLPDSQVSVQIIPKIPSLTIPYIQESQIFMQFVPKTPSITHQLPH